MGEHTIWKVGLVASAVSGVILAGGRPPVDGKPLQGKAAIAYLNEQKVYASLGEAFTAARYRVEPVEAPEQSFTAQNPAHGLHTRFERGGITLAYTSSAEGEGRRVEGREPELWSPQPLGSVEAPLSFGKGARGEVVPNTQCVLRNTSVRLTAVGRGERLAPTRTTALDTEDNRVDYTHRTADGTTLQEWYLNAPTGLEHGFFLPEALGARGQGSGAREETAVTAAAVEVSGSVPTPTLTLTLPLVPPGSAPNPNLNPNPNLPLTLALALDTDLHPEATADGQRILLRNEQGAAVLAYEKLKVWDATGRILPARILLADRNQEARLQDLKAGGQGSGVGEKEPVITSTAFGTESSEYASRSTRYAASASRETPPYTLQLLVDDHRAAYPLTIDPTWTQQQRLVASDRANFDLFGFSVALDGDTAMIGAYWNAITVPNDQRGSVYVFTRSGDTWTQQQMLTPMGQANGDHFGYAVALDGDTAVATAWEDDVGATVDQGSVYVFTRTSGVWTQQAQLNHSGAVASDQLGWSVALSGDTVVAGSVNADVDGIVNLGAAYVFTRTGGVWTQQQRLTNGATASTGFGRCVDVDGDTLVAGAFGTTVGGRASEGAVHVFTRTSGVWTQQQLLTIPLAGSQSNSNFGVSVALDGDTILSGANGRSVGGVSGSGSAFVFTRTSGVWTQLQQLSFTDTSTADAIGLVVALDGDTAVISSTGDDVGANSNQGSAFVFTRAGGTWTQQQKLIASDGNADERFPKSAAVSGTTVLLGNSEQDVGANINVGSAYVFTLQPDPPVISAVQTTSVGQTTATVTWTTDVAASSTVEYRVLGSNSYTTATGAADTSHTVNITGLTAGRTYEYRVRSITTGGSAAVSETLYPASGTLQFLTAPNLAGEVLGLSFRRLAGTIYATVTYSNASGSTQTGVQVEFASLAGTSTVDTVTATPMVLGTVNAGGAVSTTLEFSGGAGASGSTAVATVGYSSSGGGSSSSYRVTLP